MKLLKNVHLVQCTTASGDARVLPAYCITGFGSLRLLFRFGNSFTQSTANSLRREPGSQRRVKPVIVTSSET